MAGLLIPKYGSGLRRLLAAHAMAGQQLVELTATGNPAAFTTTASKPLIQCKVSFSPVQSGSGDPSPENIRPITGWTGVNVYHSGSDTSDPATYPVTWTEQGTVYGGYVDLATGVLMGEWAMKTFVGNEAWSVSASGDLERAIASKNLFSDAGYPKNSRSTKMNYMRSRSSSVWDGWVGGTGNFLCYIPAELDTTDKWKSYLAEHHLTVCYELETPVTHQLTPQQIIALAGANNIWSDANGDLTIKYLSKGE